jgi:hypothetical protein
LNNIELLLLFCLSMDTCSENEFSKMLSIKLFLEFHGDHSAIKTSSTILLAFCIYWPAVGLFLESYLLKG